MFSKKFFLTVLFCAGSLLMAAQDVTQDTARRYQQIAENGIGIQEPKVDSYGNLQSFLVIGKGAISKALPMQRAILQADKEAARTARIAVARYFNESVKWQETSANNFVAKIIGKSEGDNAGTSSTETQATDISSEQSKTCTEAAVSGIRIIWSGQDSNGLRVHIYGWNARNNAAIAGAAAQMANTAAGTAALAKSVEAVRQQDPATVQVQSGAAQTENIPGASQQTESTAPVAPIEDDEQWVLCEGTGTTVSFAVHAALVEAVQQVYGTQIQSNSVIQERFKSFIANQDESASIETDSKEKIIVASKGFVKSYRIISVTTVADKMQRVEIKALLVPPRSNKFKTVMVCPMQLNLSKLTEVIQIGKRRLSGSDFANIAPDYFERAFAGNKKFVILSYKDMPKVVSANSAAARNIAAGIVNPAEAVKFGKMLSADMLLISKLDDIQYKANRTFDPKAGKIGEKWDLRATVVFKLVDTKYGNTILNKSITVEMTDQGVAGGTNIENMDLLKSLMERLVAELTKTITQTK